MIQTYKGYLSNFKIKRSALALDLTLEVFCNDERYIFKSGSQLEICSIQALVLRNIISETTLPTHAHSPLPNVNKYARDIYEYATTCTHHRSVVTSDFV